ncbi:uncharacterized protein VP01_3809g2, partial [Puccinia sorghi]
DGRGWYFWDGESKQFISSSVEEFVDYGAKPPIPRASQKGQVDYVLKRVSFQLGKVPVEIICNEQDKMIEKIPQILDLEIPRSLKHAKRSELWDLWKKACLEDLNLLKEFDVWELRDEVKNGMEKNLKIQWEYGISRVVGIDVWRNNGIHLSQAHLATQVVNEAEKHFKQSLIRASTPLPDVQLTTTFEALAGTTTLD